MCATTIKAVHGEVDLATLDGENGKTVELKTGWDFYWKQLLAPEDFLAGQQQRENGKQRIPVLWNDANSQKATFPMPGYATYRLRIKPPLGTHELSLRLSETWPAYVLWVNGRVVAQSGIVNTEAEPKGRGGSGIRLVRFESGGAPVELVMQVSANEIKASNPGVEIMLGAADTLANTQMQRWGLALCVSGALLVMCIYHLAIFISRRKNNSAALFLGIYCLLRVTNSLCSAGSDWASQIFFPQANVQWIFVIGMACLAMSLSFLQAFFTSLYPQVFPRRRLIYIAILGAACTGFGLITKFSNEGARSCLYAYILAVTAYTLVGLLRACLARKVGARLLLLGYILLGLAGVNDILAAKEVIDSVWLTPIGTLALVMCQSFALAHWFSKAFSSAEALSSKLEVQNIALQDEMAERLRLEQEVEQVGENERRHISRALHDGLCQDLTAARLHCSLLQPSTHVSASEVKKLSALLENAVNLAYELSRGLWPVEYEERNLISALEELAQKMRTVHGLNVLLHGEMACALYTNPKEAHIYHIAKEALQNTVKHANANNVTIFLDCQPTTQILQLRIEDDGMGLSVKKSSPGGMGTRIMAHRAHMIGGTLTIEDRPEGGTIVQLVVACTKQERAQKSMDTAHECLKNEIAT